MYSSEYMTYITMKREKKKGFRNPPKGVPLYCCHMGIGPMLSDQ